MPFFFSDEYRYERRREILNLVVEQTNSLIQDVRNLAPENYNQVSSRKKIRDKQSGEMHLFH